MPEPHDPDPRPQSGTDDTASRAGSFGRGSRFFDDLAGVAGGAFSAMSGLRDEAASVLRGRIDDAVRRLDLVRRDEFDAIRELAANARAGQEAAEARIAALEARLAILQARLDTASDLPTTAHRP